MQRECECRIARCRIGRVFQMPFDQSDKHFGWSITVPSVSFKLSACQINLSDRNCRGCICNFSKATYGHSHPLHAVIGWVFRGESVCLAWFSLSSNKCIAFQKRLSQSVHLERLSRLPSMTADFSPPPSSEAFWNNCTYLPYDTSRELVCFRHTPASSVTWCDVV